MGFDPNRHHRKSQRLREHDYSSAGAYFITICVQQRECLLGEVAAGLMNCNAAGQMIHRWWKELSSKFPTVALDEFVVMPNTSTEF